MQTVTEFDFGRAMDLLLQALYDLQVELKRIADTLEEATGDE